MDTQEHLYSPAPSIECSSSAHLPGQSRKYGRVWFISELGICIKVGPSVIGVSSVARHPNVSTGKDISVIRTEGINFQLILLVLVTTDKLVN